MTAGGADGAQVPECISSPLMMSVAALSLSYPRHRSPPLVRSLLHERPARQIYRHMQGLLFSLEKKKSSKVVHLQTCAANLTSHLYLSERRWAPHRSAAKSVFLPFLSNVILIPYLADMQMCEVMMCLRGFSRAVKMKCSSTCRHPSLSRLLGCVLIRIYQAQWIPVSSWCIASHLDPVRGF